MKINALLHSLPTNLKKLWYYLRTQLLHDSTDYGRRMICKVHRHCLVCFLSLAMLETHAGNQREETLSDNVKTAMSRSLLDKSPPVLMFSSPAEAERWLQAMSQRLAKKIPNPDQRIDLLKQIHYEATRAGLNPQLVLALIQVESNFRPYAISSVGARGLMQVMPFWKNYIGEADHNLFDVKLNLRYGCTILRHYLDREKGDLFYALGRYNGSRGKPTYPDLIMNAWRNSWQWDS
jgi:soluble lytic murein transglycosylase-like protein